MSRTPFPHQLAPLDYVKGRRHIALFMEMRLGKTMVAIRWAAQYASPGRVLIVTPKSCADGIEEEIQAEGFGNITQLYDIPGAKRAILLDNIRGDVPEWEDEPHWFLVNYEACTHHPDILYEEWDAIIFDESTHLRNPRAKITKLIDRVAGRIPHRAILSGLPNPKDASDFFAQMKILLGTFMGCDNFWAWQHRFFYQPLHGPAWMWRPRPGTREKIKTELARAAFMLKRSEAKVGGRFVTEKWVVDPTPKQNAFARQIKKDFTLNGEDINWATTRDIWLARVAGGFDPTTLEPISDAKTKLITYNLTEGPLQNTPALVWFHFVKELKDFAAAAKKKKLRVAVIHGGIPTAERHTIRRDFQAGKYDVAAMQIKTGRFGQNWSRADVAIYYSHTYNPEDWAQSRDRIVHPSSSRDLLLINCVTRGTIDESIIEMRSSGYSDAQSYTRAVAADYMARLRKVMRR